MNESELQAAREAAAAARRSEAEAIKLRERLRLLERARQMLPKLAPLPEDQRHFVLLQQTAAHSASLPADHEVREFEGVIFDTGIGMTGKMGEDGDFGTFDLWQPGDVVTTWRDDFMLRAGDVVRLKAIVPPNSEDDVDHVFAEVLEVWKAVAKS